MAIPGIPTTFNVQTANGQNLVSWAISSGATAYIVQRSQDGVTFSTIATVTGSPLAVSYLDATVSLGTTYYYQVAASSRVHVLAIDTQLVYYSNGTAWVQVANPTSKIGLPSYATFSAFPAAATYTGTGVSGYTSNQMVIPTPTGELSLGAIRLKAMQRADRVNSNFVTLPEWNSYINQSMFELYDLLITTYEDYFIATPISFTSDGTTFLYPMPDGSKTFLNALTNQTFTPPALYKLSGVDLNLNNANNGFVTVNRFNFIDRNRFVYPNTSSSIYGVFNLQYRPMGSNIEFIPTPSAGQQIRLWYIPRITELLQDTDTTTVGISGWAEYIIVKAAYYALTKEESDTTSLVLQLAALQKRIEESAANRDAGQPDRISDTSRNWGGSSWGGGSNGSMGGGF